MIRIAICDDEPGCLADTKQMVEQWAKTNDVSVLAVCFDNADALIGHIRLKNTDIILMDIMMPLLNGMDAAKEIREFDKSIRIIFLTLSPEFALDSYSVKACGYLLKPAGFKQLSEVLEDCTSALKEEPKNLILKSTCGYQKIYLHDIEYIEAQNKQVVVFLRTKQPLIITQPLYSFEDKLLIQDGFFKCHRSYFVSMSHINSFHSGEVTMKSGCRIPIARGVGKKFQDAYFVFMFHD